MRAARSNCNFSAARKIGRPCITLAATMARLRREQVPDRLCSYLIEDFGIHGFPIFGSLPYRDFAIHGLTRRWRGVWWAVGVCVLAGLSNLANLANLAKLAKLFFGA